MVTTLMTEHWGWVILILEEGGGGNWAWVSATGRIGVEIKGIDTF